MSLGVNHGRLGQYSNELPQPANQASRIMPQPPARRRRSNKFTAQWLTNPFELPAYDENSCPSPLLRTRAFLTKGAFEMTLTIAHEDLCQFSETIGFVPSPCFIQLKVKHPKSKGDRNVPKKRSIPSQAETTTSLPSSP